MTQYSLHPPYHKEKDKKILEMSSRPYWDGYQYGKVTYLSKICHHEDKWIFLFWSYFLPFLAHSGHQLLFTYDLDGRPEKPGGQRGEEDQGHLWPSSREETVGIHGRHEYASGRRVRHSAADSFVEAAPGERWDVWPREGSNPEIHQRYWILSIHGQGEIWKFLSTKIHLKAAKKLSLLCANIWL